MKEDFVSIIIPVKNFERTIEKTFEYLLNVDYPHHSWEIIIADGGSKDKTVEIIKEWQKRYPFIKLVEIPDCPSPAYARNKALEIAKGDFLLFTDADCAPCKDWVKNLISPFKKDPRIGAVGGEVYTLKVDPNNLTEIYCEAFRFNMVSPRYGFIGEGYLPDFGEITPLEIAGHKAYFFGTCNVAYRREAMKDLKFWDHPTGEDMDFSHQLKLKGYKLYFAPEAKVDHMHRADFKGLRKVWVSYGEAHSPLINKYCKKNLLEIVFQIMKKKMSLKIPFFLKGFIYIGDFHFMHIFGVLTVLGFIFNNRPLGLIFLILALYSAFSFFFYCFYCKPRRYLLTWFKMKYMTNLSFIRGGLKNFKRYKVLCIEPSF